MRYLVVRTENLTKFFGHLRGIENLTIEVEPGEVYGFLGPEKSGKTTTMRLLMDQTRPTSGQALILGMDVHRQRLQVQPRVGYLPAAPAFKHFSTIGKLIDSSCRTEACRAYAREMAERLSLNLERPTGWLNPSEKQRLGLVLAFMHKPDLVILDEPTRGLDADSQDVLYRLIRETRADGRSVFFGSKALCEMERICDRVAVIHDGRLLAVERGVQLRARALRKVEMRFSGPVAAEAFARLPNLENVRLEDNKLRCILHGDPDPLLKLASQFRVMDIISQQPSLEEVYRSYYGVGVLSA